MDRANMSKLGCKRGVNCLCIFRRRYICVRQCYSMISLRWSHLNVILASSFCRSTPVVSPSFSICSSMIFLASAVNLEAFPLLAYADHLWFFVTMDKLAYANFHCCVPFFCQAVGDLYKALPQPVVKQNSLLYIILVDYLQLSCAHVRADNNKWWEGQANTQRGRTEANHTQNKCWSTSQAP